MSMERSQSRISCILFDMDGVLFNTEILHYHLWQRIFAEKGLIIDYDHYKGCIGSTVAYLMELIWEGYGLDFRNDPSLPERFRELKKEIMAGEGIPPIPGVPETLASLKQAGWPMAVASSSPQDYIELCTSRAGISQNFQLLFSGEKVRSPKPAPDVFLAVAEAMGYAPEECLVIEDSHNGVLAAKAAGMTCYAFYNPDSGDQDIHMADQIFDRFEDLLKLLQA